MMSWLLAGCCGLALIHLSVALQLTQKPRFYGVRAGERIGIYCNLVSVEQMEGEVTWYKGKSMKIQKKEGKIKFHNTKKINGTFVYIHDLHVEDSGVYFCKYKDKWGPGTHVQVVHKLNRDNAEYRSKMKDALIVFQGLLLAVCIAAVVMRKQKLQQEKRDSEYEEPETDHIYEGLAIETCGGGLYEELSVYAQADGTEAPWE